MEEPFRVPQLTGTPSSDGVTEEVLRYRIHPAKKSRFKTVLDANRLFGGADATTTVKTRIGGDPGFLLETRHELPDLVIEERLECSSEGGLVCQRFVRNLTDREGRHLRTEDVRMRAGSLAPPPHSYPEVLLPFVMRGQPREDGRTRAAYSWTCDRFIARVYYEVQGRPQRVRVPAGTIEGFEVWMYPDLNDWIPLGRAVTRLVKPFVPRYTMWFERAAPHRVLRFEGPYGPPSSPEIVFELTD